MPTSPHLPDLDEKLSLAVRQFWSVRDRQAKKSGKKKDQGSRGAVTGGAQMNGFVHLIRDVLHSAGLPTDSVHVEAKLQLPGFFRPTKKWDLVVIHRGSLIASVEFKSQVGPSFGNTRTTAPKKLSAAPPISARPIGRDPSNLLRDRGSGS